MSCQTVAKMLAFNSVNRTCLGIPKRRYEDNTKLEDIETDRRCLLTLFVSE